jgi:proline iminopeptidase
VFVSAHGPAPAPKTPLLLVHGGPGFPSYYLSPLEALADERPVIRIFEESAHLTMNDESEAYVQAIPDFLREVEAK